MTKCSVTWCTREAVYRRTGYCSPCYLHQLRHGTTDRVVRGSAERGECRAEGCKEPARVRKHQLCKLHYSRLRATGELGEATPKRIIGNDVARFWSYVDKNGPVPEHRPELGPCWLWTGACSEGRGYFGVDHKTVRVTRYMLGVIAGVNIDGLEACHHCDNPNCVNRDHLFAGTQLDNMRDMEEKGRRVNPAKVTAEFVLAARAMHAASDSNITELAEALHVNYHTLYDIVKRKTWKNI